MKQLTQNIKTGKISLMDVVEPICNSNGVIVKNSYSIISSGTESKSVNTAKSSLIGKAINRPDLTKQVIELAKKQGIKSTYKLVQDRLNALSALGYSSVGEVVEIGKNVSSIKVGDFVACAGVGYATHAELNYVPINLVAKIPKNVDLKDAVYTTLGAIATQGIRRANAQLGETIIVIGLGLIGQLTNQILKASGCKVIGLDISSQSIKKAEENGIDICYNSKDDNIVEQVIAYTKGLGADKVIITAGSKDKGIMDLSGHLCRDRGAVVIVGDVPLDFSRHIFYEKELDIKFSRSYGPGRYDKTYEEKGYDYPIGYVRWTENRNMQSFLELVANGSIKPSAITSHEVDFLESAKAYDILTDKKQICFGVVIHYNKNISTYKYNVDIAPSKAKVNIGYFGVGNFASSYVMPYLKSHKDVNLMSIMNSSGLNSEKNKTKFDFKNSVSKPDQIFNDNLINTVFISTRHNLHFDLFMRSLKSSKNIFIDKPICIKPEELDKIDKEYKSLDTAPHIFVNYNRRYAPSTIKVREMIAGDIRPISINYKINAGHIPKDHWINDLDIGGGRLVSELCHFIDFMIYITNSKVSRVFASTINSNNSSIKNTDNVSIVLDFENGSIGNINYLCDGSKLDNKEEIEIIGNDRIIKIIDFGQLSVFSKKHNKTKFSGEGYKGHKNSVQHFINSLSTKESIMNFQGVIHGMKVLFSTLESIQKGKAVSLK